ncbi:MAG TPA: glycosyltransferase [Tepidisphaeraceae bacterium]|nr:glycosyltransferase [Tepidisphaeraceae bacterium]
MRGETILFLLYCAAGPAAWLFLGWGMWRGRRLMRLVQRPPLAMPAGQPMPRVTILIPAKDEGERIRDCIQSALDQDYPNFKVIAVNDRSTDNTGQIMDEMARSQPNLTVVHIQEGTLPEGWTGKCNALQNAVKQAEGEYFLFIDSDVVVTKDALMVTVSRVVRNTYDLLSFLPRIEAHGFWEELLIPLAGAGVSTMYVVAMTNKDYLKGTAFANGQYLFIKRSVYEAMGGHARVRDRFCEDVEIARYLKPLGYKVRITWGAEFASVRMYSSLPSIFKGWGRNFYAGSLGKPWRIFGGIGFVLFSCYSVYAALLWAIYRVSHPAMSYDGQYAWLVAAVSHFVIMTSLLMVMYAWSGNRKRMALLFPLSGAMLIGIFCRSLKMCFTGKVEWRGTSYTHRMSGNVADIKP